MVKFAFALIKLSLRPENPRTAFPQKKTLFEAWDRQVAEMADLGAAFSAYVLSNVRSIVF